MIALCQHPVLDAQKRAKLCGKFARTERSVATGYGDDRVLLAFCAAHAADQDAKDREDEAARLAADGDPVEHTFTATLGPRKGGGSDA